MWTIRPSRPSLAALLCLACTLSPAALAQGAPSPFVQKSISPGLTRANFLARALAVFARLDADGDGYLDASDALAYARAGAAAARAANAGLLLAFDTDGDARVDLPELVAGLRRGLPLPAALGPVSDDPAAGGAAALVSLDRDADGRVSVAEMLALPVPESAANPVSAFLGAFPTPDGRLSREAFAAGMLASAFDRADRDGDGVLSREEVEAADAR